MKIATRREIQQQADKIVQKVKGYTITRALSFAGGAQYEDLTLEDVMDEAIDVAIYRLHGDGIFYERDKHIKTKIVFVSVGVPDRAPPKSV